MITTTRRETHDGQGLGFGAVLATLLLGFVLVAAREIGATIGFRHGGEGDSYQLFAFSLTGLVRAVFALAMGSSQSKNCAGSPAAREPLRRFFSSAYAITPTAAGATALLMCVVHLGSSTVILRSLAAAFLGTAVAVASEYFGTPPDR